MSTTSDSPESPSSLRRATSTIDDLTAALSNFSRVPSPEPPNVSTCCCGREDCESSKAWATCKAKLESRLVLSAEVGQALLERHEAYVRKHETGVPESELERLDVHSFASKRTHEEVDSRVAGLVRENAVLEKRLSQALMNNEIVDLTHSSTLEELQAAKEKIAHLTAQNARYIGIDTRLAVTLQEKDDMQQERNSATQRARMAEARITSLKEKCSKLQAQVNRLREDLEMQRSHRQELSEEILSNARERLQQLQHAHSGQTPVDDNEITEVLESLVADNEAFKRDNAELQNILAETREDMRTLQEEVEEHRAGTTDGGRSRHQQHDSIGSSIFGDQPISPTFQVGTAPALSPLQAGFAFQKPSTSGKRAISAERRIRRAFEPLTPETTRRPLTPPDSQHTTSRWSALSRARYAPSHLSAEVEEEEEDAQSERPTAHKSLLLLTRSQSVQTDGTGIPISPFTTSPIPPFGGDHVSSHEGQSDTSTLSDANPSVLGVLIERVSQLLNRLIQADALTLTTRLKRQHLVGADVPHLSRSTVNNILDENTALRTQFRAWLEDDKITTTCTRRDLRALFRLFKEVFNELGQLRVTLNDVILDPTLAGRVSELALNPSKATAPSGEGVFGAGPPGPAWMAPLSKFLGLPSGFGQEEAAVRTMSPPTRGRTPSRPPPRIVPKREPALSASTTHVNVEFSGAGIGRAVTTTSSVQAEGRLTASASNGSSVSAGETSRSVMNIFAGAPRAADPADPWVVIPKPQPQRASTMGMGRRYDMAGGATIGRSALRNAALAAGNPNGDKRLSRIVDAMIDAPQTNTSQDGEERDTVPDTLLERTLRPRGLSDSSIHTTYMAHESEPISTSPQRTVEVRAERPDRQSVLQTLSRQVQRLASQSFAVPSRPFSGATASATAETGAAPSRPQTPAESPVAEANPGAPVIRRALARAASPGGGLLPVLSSWAAVLEPAEMENDGRTRRSQNSMYVGDPREEAWGRGL